VTKPPLLDGQTMAHHSRSGPVTGAGWLSREANAALTLRTGALTSFRSGCRTRGLQQTPIEAHPSMLGGAESTMRRAGTRGAA
jgi:hypothetical protein